jgi:hypothetical protein
MSIPPYVSNFPGDITIQFTPEIYQPNLNAYSEPIAGQLRFNPTNNKFEGYHGSSGILLGEIWRPLTQNFASTSNLGVIKVGTNLSINPSTGILSAVTAGTSRYYQNFITVSPIAGAADYQDINTAISHAIGTPAGGYIDGALTSNIGSSPSHTWPFVIQLSPGQYSEPCNNIILPDYVSLIGEGNYNSVINLNTGNTTVFTGSLLYIGKNALISNVVFNINDTYTSVVSNAIYANSVSNVVIDNCIFTCNSTVNTNTNLYYIYGENSTNLHISNCKFNIDNSLLTASTTPIYLTNTNTNIVDCEITIQTDNNAVNTGILILNSTDVTVIDSKILQNNDNTYSSGVNHCILLDNSQVTIKNTLLDASNNPNLATFNGLAIQSAFPDITITSSNILSFIHDIALGNYDTITSVNTGVVNFLTLGFQRGQYISLENTVSNDGIYKIFNVPIANTIQLERCYNLTNESISSNSIILKTLYHITLEGNNITSSSNSIVNLDSNANYFVTNINTVVNASSGVISISPSSMVYENNRIITVGHENCDYQLITTALSSITNSSENNKYKIIVTPGTYIETSQIICKPWVDIEGSSQSSTHIQMDKALISTTAIDYSSIVTASYVNLSNFTLVNNATSNNSLSTACCILIPSGNENVLLDNLSIEFRGFGYTTYGIYSISSSNISIQNTFINVTPSIGNNATLYGIKFNATFGQILLDNISITSSSTFVNQYNYGLALSASNPIINNSRIMVSDSVHNFGVYCNTDSSDDNIAQLNNCNITALDSLNYSIYVNSHYTVVCNGSKLEGDTYTGPLSSRIVCNTSYTFTSNAYSTSYYTLSSRGENEQLLGTLTLGDSAGALNSTGINNLIAGVESGSNVTSASYSTILGAYSGDMLTIGDNNTFIGSSAGSNVTTGARNTILGSNAGVALFSGSDNIIEGFCAGSALVDGFQNTIIGNDGGTNLVSGLLNTFVGYQVATSLNTGNYNTITGAIAGQSIVTGSQNTIMGYDAGQSGINMNENVLMGYKAGYATEMGAQTMLGSHAGLNSTTGIKNTFIGFQSGYNATIGDCNTLVGSSSGYGTGPSAAFSGSFNTVIGNESGKSLTTGSRNVLIGSTSLSNGSSNDAAGWSLDTGTDNIILGVQAGYHATNTINNVILGTNAGSSITSAGNNILLGTNAGSNVNIIGQSVMIGTNAGQNNNNGNAVFIGYGAGVKNNDPQGFAIGYSAGSNVSGQFNMFMGYNSGGLPKLNTTGSYNMAIGPYTGFNITSGTRNIMIGTGDSIESAGRQISTGSDNTLLGYKSGKAIQTGSGNTLIGSNAGASLSSGIDNLILGYQTAFNLNNGSYNVVLGPQSGYTMNSGSYNIYTGYQAGFNNISGSNNINMGYRSGFTSQTNSDNIHIGTLTGYLSTADNNIFVGNNTGTQNTTGTYNIFMGINAGYGNNA